MTPKHTPTPWHLVDDKTLEGGRILYITSDAYNAHDIADVYHMFDGEPIMKDNAEANADFIVRACNAHDDWASKMKSAANVMEIVAKNIKGHSHCDYLALVGKAKSLREALAKADAKESQNG